MKEIVSNSMDRLLLFVDSLGVSDRKFAASCGFSNGVMSSIRKKGTSLGADKMENIFYVYPQLNAEYIFRGKEPMLHDQNFIEKRNSGIANVTKSLKDCEKIREENTELKGMIKAYEKILLVNKVKVDPPK